MPATTTIKAREVEAGQTVRLDGEDLKVMQRFRDPVGTVKLVEVRNLPGEGVLQITRTIRSDPEADLELVE